jgi:preprotein translocase subunit SecG
MFTFLTVLIIIVCVLLVLVVLAQNSKGGGLASGFTGGSQMMGVKKTTDFIEKLTWGLAVALVLLCLGASLTLSTRSGGNDNTSTLQEQAENAKSNAGRNPMQQQQQPAGQPQQAPQPAPAPKNP